MTQWSLTTAWWGTFTCDPDVYSAFHQGDLVVNFNVTWESSFEFIEYTYDFHSVFWTYQSDTEVVEIPYLVVDIDDPAVNSSSHYFTITMNRCTETRTSHVYVRANVKGVDDPSSFIRSVTLQFEGKIS